MTIKNSYRNLIKIKKIQATTIESKFRKISEKEVIMVVERYYLHLFKIHNVIFIISFCVVTGDGGKE